MVKDGDKVMSGSWRALHVKIIQALLGAFAFGVGVTLSDSLWMALTLLMIGCFCFLIGFAVRWRSSGTSDHPFSSLQFYRVGTLVLLPLSLGAGLHVILMTLSSG